MKGEIIVKRKAKKKAPAPIVIPESPVYAFPSKVRCPRGCGETRARIYGTTGDTQYRECMRPTCRHRFTVKGEVV